MWVKADGDVWVNLGIATGIQVYENTSTDWWVRSSLGSGPTIRTFTTQAAAEAFVTALLSEQGLSGL
jgi:hypothetical protein